MQYRGSKRFDVYTAGNFMGIRRMQEQSGKRQEAERRLVAEQIEAERRATEKYKSELEGKVQRERALAEAEGRAREKRENEDVDRRYCSRQISRLARCQNQWC